MRARAVHRPHGERRPSTLAGDGLPHKRLRFALFTLAPRETSHAGVLVMKHGRQADELADVMASRMGIAQLSIA
jgi:hypothetical protein